MTRPICPFLAMDISEMDISEMTSSKGIQICPFPICPFYDKPPFLPDPLMTGYAQIPMKSKKAWLKTKLL
jgi:hypothetical protein